MATQSEKDQKINELLDEKFKEATEYRRPKESGWKEAESFYNGNHWPSGQRRPFKNHIFRIIESEVPILTDSKPSTDIIPMDPDNDDAARILDAAKTTVYEEQNLNLKDTVAIKDALKVGTAYQYVDFDPDARNGEGDVVVKNLLWKQVYPDPTANFVEECRYVGFKFPVDTELLKRRFPEKKKEIEKINPEDHVKPTFVDDYIDEDQNMGQMGSRSDSRRFESDSLTTLEELWHRDYSLEKIDPDVTEAQIAEETVQLQQGINPDISRYEDHELHMEGHEEQKMFLAAEALGVDVSEVTEEDIERLKNTDDEIALVMSIIDDHISMHELLFKANESISGKQPKYKNNLRLTMRVGKTILYDGPSPVDDGEIPLAVFYCYKDGQSFYGTSEAQNLIPIQKSLNEMDWSEYMGLRLVSNPGWVVDEQSGVDETTLNNEPGLVVVKKQGTEVQRLSPGQVSPQLPVRRDSDNIAMQEIAGVNEAVLGKAPSSDPSGRAVQRLQQQAIGRIRLKSRMLEEYTIPRRDKLILSRIIKFYSTERKLRIHDDNGQIRFIDFSPEQVRNLDYEIAVSPGSVAGLDKESIFTIATQLLQAGIIDGRTLVEMTDLPYRSNILKSIDENDQQAAQVEQLLAENIQLKAEMGVELSEEEIAIAQELGILQ